MNHREIVAPISDLLEERKRLLDLARGFLSSTTAAEEAVRETYGRWYAVGDHVADPEPWPAGTPADVCLRRPGRAPGGAARGDEPRAEAVAETARRPLRGLRARRAGAGRHHEVVRAFRKACESHDPRLLAGLLASDVSAVFDGGGRIRTPEPPVGGARNVIRCLGALLDPDTGVVIAEDSVNGRTGLVAGCGRQVAAAISRDVHADRVVNVWLVLNPGKLRRWNRA
ncbi:hypothetical protein ACFW3D_04495 [Streptomyces sp. NPDC058864]